jgi:hypothetical protein
MERIIYLTTLPNGDKWKHMMYHSYGHKLEVLEKELDYITFIKKTFKKLNSIAKLTNFNNEPYWDLNFSPLELLFNSCKKVTNIQGEDQKDNAGIYFNKKDGNFDWGEQEPLIFSFDDFKILFYYTPDSGGYDAIYQFKFIN